jgi:hypothetical protein
VYYNDGDTSQWVEVKSNTASGSTVAARVDALEAKPNGLVPIIPSSVTVSAGSASISATGLVSFSSVSSIKLFNIFPTTYSRFLISFSSENSMGGDAFMQLMDSAGTVASSSYQWKIVYSDYGVSSVGFGGTSGSNLWYSYNSGAFGGISITELKLQNPNFAKNTSAIIHAANNSSAVFGSGYHSVATAYSGASFSWTSAANGSFQVYGYR